jgi:hypothetical protein
MILMVYILTLIGTIALIFFSVDWTIELYKWQSRIHIGRWTDRKAWQQAVEKKARQWLYKSPTVQITDQDRLVLWDMWIDSGIQRQELHRLYTSTVTKFRVRLQSYKLFCNAE